jgi:S1-C subfamily serine protease
MRLNMTSRLLVSHLIIACLLTFSYASRCFASAPPIDRNTVADIAQAVAPSVVNIEVDQPINHSGYVPLFDLPMGGMPFGFRFFNNAPGGRPLPGGNRPAMPNQPKMESHNTASGFIIRPDGYILTNSHVVRDASKIKVTLSDSRVYEGSVVGVDNFSDLAVVKIDAHELPTVKMGTSSNLRPGDFAIAIGSPMGFDHTVTFGIISAVGRAVTDINGNINFIQTDAAINRGNSGGPLINLDGEVIGVNTAILASAQNMGFSIPIDVAKTVMEDLIAHKKILRPWLGIAMHEIDEAVAKSLAIPATTKGIAIVKVINGSPAQAAGLETGDIIQKIDGQNVATAKEVQELVRAHKVSDTIHLFLLRNKVGQAMSLNIGQYPSSEQQGAYPVPESEDE